MPISPLHSPGGYGIVAGKPPASERGVGIGRRIMTALLVIVLAIAGAGLAARIYFGRPAENRLRPGEAVPKIALLRSPLPRNSFLACPPGYCPDAKAAPSPVFAMPWERLRDYWFEMIAEDTRIKLIESDPERRHLVYIQHTPLLRYPDIVTVEFAALPADHSSIALYSRSRYGRSDFGKNKQRIERWLGMLERAAGAAAKP
jgi:uncharacterized protein (DUF1499 family)